MPALLQANGKKSLSLLILAIAIGAALFLLALPDRDFARIPLTDTTTYVIESVSIGKNHAAGSKLLIPEKVLTPLPQWAQRILVPSKPRITVPTDEEALVVIAHIEDRNLPRTSRARSRRSDEEVVLRLEDRHGCAFTGEHVAAYSRSLPGYAAARELLIFRSYPRDQTQVDLVVQTPTLADKSRRFLIPNAEPETESPPLDALPSAKISNGLTFYLESLDYLPDTDQLQPSLRIEPHKQSMPEMPEIRWKIRDYYAADTNTAWSSAHGYCKFGAPLIVSAWIDPFEFKDLTNIKIWTDIDTSGLNVSEPNTYLEGNEPVFLGYAPPGYHLFSGATLHSVLDSPPPETPSGKWIKTQVSGVNMHAIHARAPTFYILWKLKTPPKAMLTNAEGARQPAHVADRNSETGVVPIYVRARSFEDQKMDLHVAYTEAVESRVEFVVQANPPATETTQPTALDSRRRD